MKINATRRLLQTVIASGAMIGIVVLSPGCKDKTTVVPPPLNKYSACPSGDPTMLGGQCQSPPGAGETRTAITTGALAAGTAATALRSAGSLVSSLGRGTANFNMGEPAPSMGNEYAKAGFAGSNAAQSKDATAIGAKEGGGAKGADGGNRGSGSAGGGGGGLVQGSSTGSGGSVATDPSVKSDSGTPGTGGAGATAADSAYAGGGGGGAAGRTPASADSDAGALAEMLKGGNSADGSSGDGSNAASLQFLKEPDEISPMGTPDPADYFSRFNPSLSLFEVVSNRYRRTTMRWPLDALR